MCDYWQLCCASVWSFADARAVHCSFLNYKTEPETADTDEKIKLSVWAFFDENTPGTYYVRSVAGTGR